MIHFPDESTHEREWIDRLMGNGTGDYNPTRPPGAGNLFGMPQVPGAVPGPGGPSIFGGQPPPSASSSLSTRIMQYNTQGHV